MRLCEVRLLGSLYYGYHCIKSIAMMIKEKSRLGDILQEDNAVEVS